MGLFDWYPFIRRKGFNPALLYYTLLASIETVGRRRLDVLGTCFSTIKDSYTKHSPEIAHEKLMREIERYGTTDNMTLYIDGPQAVEKMWTAQTREAKREKAMVRLDGNLDAFASRMNNGLRMKKQQFIAIKKDLGLSFYWSLESRAEFVEYMRDLGWTVVFCDTEADVRLARDAEPGDVIISRDSDMLGYANIKTIWRPVSKSLILVYNMSDVLKAIGLSRNQLTALAVVSRNDYQRNIYSLGPATNLGIIKKIEGSADSRRIVATYLSDSKVLSRNEQQETFQNSMRVFIDMVQTPVMMQAPTEDGSLSPPAQGMYAALQQRFKDLCQEYESLKRTETLKAARPPEETVVRLRAPRSHNRYRTVESPKFVSSPPPLPSQPTSSPSQPTSASQERAQPANSPQLDSGHPPLTRTRIPRNRERFSFKERRGDVIHKPPPKAKQFVWKPPKKAPESLDDTSTSSAKKDNKKKDAKAKNTREKTSSKEGSNSNEERSKQSLVRSLGWHHPISALDVGTLKTNVDRVLTDRPDLQLEVINCINEGSELAADIKRKAQGLIGGFLEKLQIRMKAAEVSKRQELRKAGKRTMSESERLEARRDAVTKDERDTLDYLCERVELKVNKCGDDDADDSQKDSCDLDAEGKENKQFLFLRSLLTYLYSRNLPGRNSKIGKAVSTFINILVGLQLFDISRNRSEINETMLFTASSLVRSVAGQLSVELKKMYSNGSHLLYDQVKALKDKGRLEAHVDIRIHENISAAENYLALNELIPNSWRLAPITSSQQPFVTFSERELATFFWKRPLLKQRLVDLALSDEDSTTLTSINDLENWIGGREPGVIIKNFISDIDPVGLSNRQKRKTGHRGAIKLLSLSEIRDHLQLVEETKPKDYHRGGYIPHGSIRTTGFLVQVMAFKLRERQDARFKRLPEEDMPSRITTAVAGVDYFLQEIRNVIKSEQDIEELWPGKDVDRMKILTLDGGQACVVGAFAHLPNGLNGKENAKEGPSMDGIITTNQESTSLTNQRPAILDPVPTSASTFTSTQPPVADSLVTPSSSAYYNLAIKQKAVYQPSFRFRRWLENEKMATSQGEQKSIAHIETHLPPLRGQNASVVEYVRELEQVEQRLKDFYTGDDHRYQRHQWDMTRARQAEYQTIAERLLAIVGGSLGRRVEDNKDTDPILIGVGLGQFESKSRLSSLHSTFLSYFIQKARSLGYVVVGLNEFYTSKKCPRCTHFVAQVTLRSFYCFHCQIYHHRDVMAAHNMSNIVQGHLSRQERPEYLQPVNADGTFPWKDTSGKRSSTGTSRVATGSTSTDRVPGRRKRTNTVSSQDQGRHGKSARA